MRLNRGRVIVTSVALAMALVSVSERGEAHKPITSPFTFNEDVFPIVQARCAGCHVREGVAPMSLLTHMDAVPWGESMRGELMAGHMPPWAVESAPGRFRNAQGLTARELNILMTWASGGTPPGDPEKAPPAIALERRWPLGEPDLLLDLPQEITLAEQVQERTVEFTLPAGAAAGRLVRAVDLSPGTPAIVRSAMVWVKDVVPGREGLLALWQPGDHPIALDAGTAFALPADAELVVRVRYRKTWEYERQTMRDRSRIGIYFADAPAVEVGRLELAARADSGTAAATLDAPLRVLALYPDPDVANRLLRVVATRPDGSREELITFRPLRGWARRYWFREPIALPRGTRIEMVSREDEGELLPPGAVAPDEERTGSSPPRVILNVVPAG